MYPNTYHYEDSNNTYANTTGNDETLRISSITGTLLFETNSVCKQALGKHNLNNSVAVASSYVKSDTNQYNSVEYKQSDNSALINRYRCSNNSTPEQICRRCNKVQEDLSQFQERLEQLNGEVEHICELIIRESKSEKEGIFYRICRYVSKYFLLSNDTQDNTCSKLKEISKFIEYVKKNFDEQEIFIEQNRTEMENLKHQNKVLQGTIRKLQSEKELQTTVLNKEIRNLQETHKKTIIVKDDLIVHWQQRFDAKVSQCRNLEKDIAALHSENESKLITLNKEISDLKEKYTKEINTKNDLVVHWQQRFDTNLNQCKKIQKGMTELRVKHENEITSLQHKLSRKFQSALEKLQQEVSEKQEILKELEHLQQFICPADENKDTLNKFKELSNYIKILKKTLKEKDVSIDQNNQEIKKLQDENNKLKHKLQIGQINEKPDNLKKQNIYEQDDKLRKEDLETSKKLRALAQLIRTDKEDLAKERKVLECFLSKMLALTENFKNKVCLKDVELETEIWSFTKTPSTFRNLGNVNQTDEETINVQGSMSDNKPYSLQIREAFTRVLQNNNATEK